MNAPPRPCPHPHCGRLTTGGRCARHPGPARPSARARGYDSEWAEYSRAWLKRFPWCGQRLDAQLHPTHSRCAAEGRQVLAAVTDHIVAIANGGARLDPTNHQSLCVSCNVRKGRGVDAAHSRTRALATPRARRRGGA